ncbi:unnamed protein product [Cyclocybe aegerita]|uniref:Putative gamma-glutamylcyclotransferase n=1 Tax=Cyclocybe aegerita TaxID=1973307 RepID=A0A8S0XRM5_CYCAE|nr:unnamed protein product [Cyclocybe aegerita]
MTSSTTPGKTVFRFANYQVKPTLYLNPRRGQQKIASDVVRFPATLFAYGTLQVPHVLRSVLNVEKALCPAAVHGYAVKMWGPYPALVKTPGPEESTVHGMLFLVMNEEELKRLIRYETENYRLEQTEITAFYGENKSMTSPGYIFVWNGYPEALQEGVFDPTQFQQRHGSG